MKISAFTAALLAIIFVFSLSVYSCGITKLPVDELAVSAEACILVCANTGETVYSKNADTKLPMASTTKLMTALVVSENAELSDVVSVTKESVGIEGSSMYLHNSERISVEDLLYALLLQSANDAAYALALHTAGSVEGFAKLMNDRAASIGMKNSSFVNPHGLDDEMHYTTAYDLSLLMRECIRNETVSKIMSTAKYTTVSTDDSHTRVFSNHNRLLRTYDGCIGGKTGYTKRCGRCLVTAASRDGLTFICVTLNAPDDWKDHTALYDRGFADYRHVELCGSGEISYDVPIIGGKSAYVEADCEGVSAVISANCNTVTQKVFLNDFYYADISEGEKLGSVVFYCDKGQLAHCSISATQSVERIKYKANIFQRILDFFQGR